MTQNPSDSAASQNAPDREPGAPVIAGRARWPWFLLGGLLAVLLFLGWWFFFRQPVEAEPPVAVIDLQESVNESLQAEIDRYRNALAGDVCTEPRLEMRPDVTLPPASAVPPDSVAPAAVAPSSVAELMEQATVFILAVSENGASIGSGFFFAPDLIFTNYHVLSPVKAELVMVTNRFLGEAIPARVITSSAAQGRDYAVLQVQPPAGRQPAYLSFSLEAQRTTPVSAWGFPGLAIEEDPRYHALLEGRIDAAPEVVYTAGVISVIQAQRMPPLIAHTAEVSQGSSGGPLVDAQGRVLGVNTQIHVDRESNRQLNVAIASSDIVGYLREAGLVGN